MRCDQYIGLNERAETLVAGEQVLTEKIGEIEGAWDPVVAELHKYTLPDGRVYSEKVQADPWASGPCYFVALVDETGAWVSGSLWTEEEIQANL